MEASTHRFQLAQKEEDLQRLLELKEKKSSVKKAEWAVSLCLTLQPRH